MKINDLTINEKLHVLKSIDELRKSNGWGMLQQLMAEEREQFFRKMSEPQSVMTDPKKIDYTRGIIEGTYRLADLPDTICARLEADIQIHNAQQAANLPPKQTTP